MDGHVAVVHRLDRLLRVLTVGRLNDRDQLTSDTMDVVMDLERIHGLPFIRVVSKAVSQILLASKPPVGWLCFGRGEQAEEQVRKPTDNLPKHIDEAEAASEPESQIDDGYDD